MLAHATPPLTAMLRTATQASHQALDSMPILVEIASGKIDPRRYVSVITAFATVWRTAEPRAWTLLVRRIPGLSDLRDLRAILLDEDIAALAGRAERRSRSPAMEIADAAEAAGILYVLEGARLGGRLIADRLHKAGHPIESPGYRFFGALRDDVAERWRQFRALVDAAIWSPAECERACSAASATFQAIADSLESELARA